MQAGDRTHPKPGTRGPEREIAQLQMEMSRHRWMLTHVA